MKITQIILAALTTLVLPGTSIAHILTVDTTEVVKGVTAHRGNSIAYPENTLVAFQAGIDAHADWVELDIHKTKDGQIVVSHDATTKRTGDKNLVIANSTYQELLEVDVATAFRNEKGLSKVQCPAQRIPLLKEALALIMKQKRTHLSIQPKTDCVAEAIGDVNSAGAERMVGFNDGSLAYMSQVKKLAPQIPVFWDRLPATDVDDDIRVAREKGFESIVIYYKGITAEKVGKIKAAGISAGAWTVDDRATMESLLQMGIDRIYTNDPALLITVKKSLIK